jgi:hypothetical protein
MIMPEDILNYGIIGACLVNARFVVYGRIICYKGKMAKLWQNAHYATGSSTQRNIRAVPFGDSNAV